MKMKLNTKEVNKVNNIKTSLCKNFKGEEEHG